VAARSQNAPATFLGTLETVSGRNSIARSGADNKTVDAALNSTKKPRLQGALASGAWGVRLVVGAAGRLSQRDMTLE
jgi:hypothetical protein